MSCCLFGICVPYSAILPVLIILLKPVWEYVAKMMGIDTTAKKGPKQGDPPTSSIEGEKCGPCCAPAEAKAKNVEAKAVVIPEGDTFYLSADTPWKGLLAASVEADKTLIARFTASWCAPCKKVEPFFNSLAAQRRGEAVFVSVDVDAWPDVMDEYSLVGIPYFLALRRGAVTHKYRGSDEGGVKKMIDEALVPVAGRA